ncbi:hypothetical protein ACHAW5_002060 [Stephanodiscus triporus]|uniref:Uncharacterized protein n=1 Tax=Stephanodiscus triporus TaxID=2934178 RepID=A0ABD3NQ84_9STRA
MTVNVKTLAPPETGSASEANDRWTGRLDDSHRHSLGSNMTRQVHQSLHNNQTQFRTAGQN